MEEKYEYQTRPIEDPCRHGNIDKMDKTIVVAIIDSVVHPLYKKVVATTKIHGDETTVRHRRQSRGYGNQTAVRTKDGGIR